MKLWKSIVGKLWATIIALVALVLMFLGLFLLDYIDTNFTNSNEIKRLFLYTSIVGFLLTTFFAFFLSSRITQPLRELKHAAHSIRAGDYRPRVQISSTDEIGELAEAFNHMASQLEETIKDLNHEKEHLSSILRSMTDAVITFDASGGVLQANPQGMRIVEDWNNIVIEPETVGVDFFERSIPEPLRQTFLKVVTEHQEMATTLNVKEEVWSVVMNPLYSQEMLRGVVAVMRDVTEEYRLEKLRQDFVANVSHELRTPLSMLQGYSEALLDDIASSPEERQELAQIIHDESLRMGRLVYQLLDLARMETGRLEMNCDEVDIGQLAVTVQRKFSTMAKEQGLHVNVDHRLDAGDSASIACADRDRLEQVMTNLIDNAMRYSPRNASIVIGVDTVFDEALGKCITFFVADEGEGIPEEDLKFIFDRFYKADKARTRGKGNNTGGTGLGLAISKNIVEAHGGELEVDSKLGEGTTFFCKIPCESSIRL